MMMATFPATALARSAFGGMRSNRSGTVQSAGAVPSSAARTCFNRYWTAAVSLGF